MKKNSAITQTAFDKMLSWLDADREEAGRKYEKIRRRLIEIFASRGFQDAEDLADETINRVARKSEEVADGYVGDPAYFFYGVAKKIILEQWKVKAPAVMPPAPVPSDEIEREYQCLEQCLGRLPQTDREVIQDYFSEEGQIDKRKKLAERLGIGLNALRIRIFRVKLPLKQCLEDCLGQTMEL